MNAVMTEVKTKKQFTEASELTGVTALGGGKYRIKIIQPGPGSSGTYLAENLAASAPLFIAGTQMYLDHPTESDEWERPERSLRDLAGKFLEDATVGEDGSLYTVVQVYPTFDEIIREKWADIGVSIIAWSYGNLGPNGEVPPFDGVESVDFVTRAGAGGAILELLESARAAENNETKENELDEAKFEAFVADTAAKFGELSAKLDGLKPAEPVVTEPPAESVSLSDALAIADKIAEAKLPEGATARVVAAIEAGADVDKAIADESEYVTKIAEAVKPKVTKVDEDEDGTNVKEAAKVSAFARTRKDK